MPERLWEVKYLCFFNYFYGHHFLNEARGRVCESHVIYFWCRRPRWRWLNRFLRIHQEWMAGILKIQRSDQIELLKTNSIVFWLDSLFGLISFKTFKEFWFFFAVWRETLIYIIIYFKRINNQQKSESTKKRVQQQGSQPWW